VINNGTRQPADDNDIPYFHYHTYRLVMPTLLVTNNRMLSETDDQQNSMPTQYTTQHICTNIRSQCYISSDTTDFTKKYVHNLLE